MQGGITYVHGRQQQRAHVAAAVCVYDSVVSYLNERSYVVEPLLCMYHVQFLIITVMKSASFPVVGYARQTGNRNQEK